MYENISKSVTEKEVKKGEIGEFSDAEIVFNGSVYTLYMKRNVGRQSHCVRLVKSKSGMAKTFVSLTRAIGFLDTLGYRKITYYDDTQNKQ